MRSLEEIKALKPEDKVRYYKEGLERKAEEAWKKSAYQKYKKATTQVTGGGTVNPIWHTQDKGGETYAEMTRRNDAKRRVLESEAGYVPETSVQDAKNLIYGTPKRGGTVNPTISAADFYSMYDMITPQEAGTYKHYKTLGDEKKASEYLKAITPDINRRSAEKRIADTRQLAEDSTMGGLYARYMASLSSPLGAAYSLVQSARGEAIDPNSPFFLAEHTRQGQEEAFIGNSTGAAKLAKQAGLAAFDWGTQIATLGALGFGGEAMNIGNSALYGASAYAGNTKDAAERGATPTEAAGYGVIGAAAEVVTERLGFERLFKLGGMANKGAIRQVLKGILPNMASEGLEEGATEAVNLISDALIMGDRSQMAEIYNTAKAQGMSEGQAAKEAILAGVKQIGTAASVGAISGGMIAGGVAGGSRLAGRNILPENNDLPTMAPPGEAEASTMALPGEAEAQQAALKTNAPTLESNKDTAGNAVKSQENTIKSHENVTKATENVTKATENVTKATENVTKATENVTETPENVIKSHENVVKSPENVFKKADSSDYAGKYFYEAGQRLIQEEEAKRGNVDFIPGVQTYYEAGLAGILEKNIKQTAYTAITDRELLTRAYLAGSADRKADVEARLKGKSKLKGEAGVVLATEAATEAQKALAKLVADTSGAEVMLVDRIGSVEEGYKNGYYKDGRIVVALNADSFAGTLWHESIHYIKEAAPEAYEFLQQTVFQMAAEREDISVDAYMNRYREEYEEVYKDITAADVIEEMTADAFMAITKDEKGIEDMIQRLSNEDPTMLEKLQEFLEKLIESLQALIKDQRFNSFSEDIAADVKQAEALRDMLANGLRYAGEQRQTRTGETVNGEEREEKYAIRYTDKNVPFVVVEENILDGVPKKEWVSVVKENLKKKFPKGARVGNEQIRIDKQSREEMTYSNYTKSIRRYSRETYKDKFVATNNADEILKASRNYVGEALKHERKDAIIEFARGTVLLRIGENEYTAEVVVGTRKDNTTFLYDVINLKRTKIKEKQKKRDTQSAKPTNEETGRIGVSLKDNIPQQEQKDNYKNIINSDIEDAKFSLQQPIEETKDLIAVHNLSEENLKKALQMGGFPAPSIAVVKDTMGHEKFGEISVVFGKDTIDPKEDDRNAIYGGDSWTPTVPDVDYPVNYEKKKAIEHEIEELAGRVANGIFKERSIFAKMGVNDETSMSERELVNKLAEKDLIWAAYLADHGIDIEPEYVERQYDQYGNEFLSKIVERIGEDEIAKMEKKLEKREELSETEVIEIRDIWKQHWIDKMPSVLKKRLSPERIAERAAERAADVVTTFRAGLFVEHAWKMQNDGAGAKEFDRLSMADKMREVAERKDVTEWLERKLEGVLGKPGIYNGKEYYTPSGNRRKFEQTHYDYTLENLVRAMKTVQKDRGEGMFGIGASGLQAVATPKYASITEMKADKDRLQRETQEKHEKQRVKLDEGIEEIIKAVRRTNKAKTSNSYEERDLIWQTLVEAAKGKKTEAAIKKAFEKDGYMLTKETAGAIIELYREAASIPTEYFEAKPKRGVGIEEIRYIVLPNDTGKELRTELSERDIPVVEYEQGSEESRLAALNSLEDAKFSIKQQEYEELLEENEHLKAANEALRQQFEITKDAVFDSVSTKRAVKQWLKKHSSVYDADTFTEKYLALCKVAAKAKNDTEYNQVMTALQMLAEEALQESGEIDTTLRDENKELIKKIRMTTIKVNEETKAELEYYGGYNQFRKANFGRIRLSSKNGVAPDTFFQELEEEYPQFFSTEGVATQGDMLLEIVRVLDSLKPVIHNPYGYDLSGYALDAAYELFDMFQEGQLKEPTFADRYEAKLEKVREKYKRELEEYKEWSKENYREWKREYKDRRREKEEYRKHRRSVEKNAKTLLKWIENPTDKYHIPRDMLAGVQEFLLKIQTSDDDITLLQSDLRKAVANLKRTQAEGAYIEFDESIEGYLELFQENFGDGVHLKDMTAAEMQALSNIVRSMKKTITDANRLVSSGRNAQLHEVAEGYMEEVEKQKAARQVGTLHQLSNFFNISMVDAPNFFKGMGETVYSQLYGGFREGFNRKITHVKEATEFMAETIDQKTIKEWRKAPSEKFEIGGKEIYLSVPQMMSLWCLMKRRQGKRHILGYAEKGQMIRGGGIKAEPNAKSAKKAAEALRSYEAVQVTESDVRKILEKLTPEQKEAADKIQKYLSEDAAAWGNETSMLLFGYEKFKDNNYFPIVSDKNYVNTTYGTDKKHGTLRSMGMTKTINKYANNPVILQDIFSVYAKHIDQMTSYNAFVPIMSDMNKFLNYKKLPNAEGFEAVKSVKQSMERVMGKGGLAYINNLMERINGVAGKDDTSTLPKMLLRNMKIASVGANLRVVIQQPMSYMRAFDVLDPKYLLGAVAAGKADYEAVNKYAPIAQWKEWGNYEMDTGRTMEQLMCGLTPYQQIGEWSMIAAAAADKLTWGRIWKACEMETKDKYPELKDEKFYKKVGERFTQVIDETQVVDSILHRSQIMRSTNFFNKMTTSFMSEPIKTYNMFRNAVLNYGKERTPENAKKMVRTFVTLTMNGIAVSAAAGIIDMMRDDDEEKSILEKWLSAFRGDYSEAEKPTDYILAVLSSNLGDNFSPMNYIPYLRDLQSMLQGYDVVRTDFSGVADMIRCAKKWLKFAEGESPYTLNALLLEAAGSVSKVTGIPINSAKRDLTKLKDTIINHACGSDLQYSNKKLTYDVGSPKNAGMYVGMMIRAKMEGNTALATRIYNDMVNHGVDNDTIEGRIKTAEKKLLEQEAETLEEGAEAYRRGDYNGYSDIVRELREKGYTDKSAKNAIQRIYNEKEGKKEDEETFDTITENYWDEEISANDADYDMMFNAYMNGNRQDYEAMWDLLEAGGKKKSGIKTAMKNRAKKAYQEAQSNGNYAQAQKAREEFLRLGGKVETLLN